MVELLVYVWKRKSLTEEESRFCIEGAAGTYGFKNSWVITKETKEELEKKVLELELESKKNQDSFFLRNMIPLEVTDYLITPKKNGEIDSYRALNPGEIPEGIKRFFMNN